jgi:type II secretory pathway pseudopilin PulG
MNTTRTIPCPRRSCRCRGGFTLIEAALVTVIVGVGFMAMLQLVAAGTNTNIQGALTTTGLNLARNVREMSLQKTFADVQAMNNKTWSPAIDGRGAALDDFKDWSQTVTVQAVDPDWLTADNGSVNPDAVRLTVTVKHNADLACQASWYIFK